MEKLTQDDLQLMDAFRSLDMDDTLVVKFKRNEKDQKLPMVDYAYHLSDIIKELEKNDKTVKRKG